MKHIQILQKQKLHWFYLNYVCFSNNSLVILAIFQQYIVWIIVIVLMNFQCILTFNLSSKNIQIPLNVIESIYIFSAHSE